MSVERRIAITILVVVFAVPATAAASTSSRQIASLKRQVASLKRSSATLRTQRDAARSALTQMTVERDQNRDLVASVQANLATAQADRDAAQHLAANQAGTITSLNAALAASDVTITNQQGTITSLNATITSQAAAIKAAVAQQVTVMTVADLFVLLEAIYARFPTDFLNPYSASKYVSGTYVSYSFTHSP